MRNISVCGFLVLGAVTFCAAMPYEPESTACYAERHNGVDSTMPYDVPPYEDYSPSDCSNFASAALQHGFGGPFAWGRTFTKDEWDALKQTQSCHQARRWLDPHGCLPFAADLRHHLVQELHCPSFKWTHGTPRPGQGGVHIPEQIRRGDIGFYYDPTNSYPWHAVIITFVDQLNDIIQFDAHTKNRHHEDFLSGYPLRTIEIVHLDDIVNECNFPEACYPLDSTVKRDCPIQHGIICCWHENLGGKQPWTENPTAYACLSWSENSGTTWDTIQIPRLNLAGCTTVVLRELAHSNLQHGSGKTIEVRGSTDDGVTWPYLVGDDSLTQANLPWATNQRRVRIAWIYRGPVQPGRYWCVDDIEVFAKPGRGRDVSVSQIKYPTGLITQGKPITPAVYVWNHGRVRESVWVTLNITPAYAHAVLAVVSPYNDTFLEFPAFYAGEGNHAASCFVSMPGDECFGNDSAELTFRVVADTWVKMFPVYGGGGMWPGSCMAPTDSESIFCVPGQRNYFAKYVVTQNLWKNRAPTPQDFGSGAALSYPGSGNRVYAFRALSTKSFYSYRTDGDYWQMRAETPDKIGGGAALVWAGGNYLYALRGNLKKSFYRYNIDSNTWDTPAQTPGGIRTGGALVWGGGDYLYALRGGDHYDFYRYQISTNQWVSRASTPVPVDDGGALAYYPQGNKLYAFCGDGSYYFYAYNISSNSWSSRGYTPGPVTNGGCLTYCDYSIFGGLGEGEDENFWRYSPPVGGFDEPGPEPVPPAVEGLGAQSADAKAGDNPSEQNPDRAWDTTRAGALGHDPNSSTELGHVPGRVVSRAGEAGDGGSFGEELLTYDPTNKRTPDYSPSDSWITYTADDTARGCFGLYRILATGGQPEMVSTDGRTYEDPKYSHDGAFIIAKADDGIFRLDPDGVSSARLTEGIASLPRWSESDSWVTYERWDTTLHTHRACRVRIDGTQDTCLVPDTAEYLSPQPVSDSEVVCIKFKDEVYQLCRIRNGATFWLTSDYMNNAGPDLSPSREWCTYEKLDESGYWQVYCIKVNGDSECRITDGTCNCLTPVYSHDGNYIAYSKWPHDSAGSSEHSQICYRPAGGGEETSLNGANAVRRNPCWSHDASYIVYEKVVTSGALGGPRKKHAQLARIRTRISYAGVEAVTELPGRFELYQNRPNPFRTATAIRYALPHRALAELTIYDVAGRVVTKLVQSEQKPGFYTVKWRGNDARGRSVAAGTYFYVLKADGKIAQKRMLLVR